MLTNLKQIIQEVSQIPELPIALARLTSMVKQTMQVDSCSIYLANYDKRELLLAATDGLGKDAVGEVRIGFDEGIIGLVGNREEPINIEDAQSHPHYKHYALVEEEDYHAFIGTPIMYQRKVLGVISMQHTSVRRFNEDEEAFLTTLAAQIALELINAEILGSFSVDSKFIQGESRRFNGIPGAPGLALAKGLVHHAKHELKHIVPKRTTGDVNQVSLYRKAVEITRTQVSQLSATVKGTVPEDVSAIFQLYHHLLDANSLGREVEAKIREGWDAPSSLKIVIDDYASRFARMDDAYMRERAVDIVDLSNRILSNMLSDPSDSPNGDTHNKNVRSDVKSDTHRKSDTHKYNGSSYILVAKEITATTLAQFPRESLAGVISLQGSNNSHAAILARAMGVPAVMGLSRLSLGVFDNHDLFIDGYSGLVEVNPNQSAYEGYQRTIEQENALYYRIQSAGDQPSITQDGHEVSLLVNAGLSANIEVEQFKQGDGVGLYRTEIPFMLRERFPSEQEQYVLYHELLSAFPDKEITMRTLDVGGDKPLSYFPIVEDNPFLGWRGIRLTLDHPDIFLVQIRAMLRASVGLSNLQILLPMISGVAELKEAKRLIEQAFQEVKDETSGTSKTLHRPTVGVMLEVPAVVFQLPALAKHVDFFSVGSNDLTQYLLAVDRNNTRVSNLYSSYHPSVLAVLKQIIDFCQQHSIPVTVCGELAGEPIGALVLLAMGYRKLSMNAHSLRKVNWVLRSIDLSDTHSLLDAVLAQDTQHEVNELLVSYLESKGLGGLIRAGS